MKKLLRAFIILNLFSLNLLAQPNYQGKLGFAVSPEGFPYDYSKLGEFLQEVSDICQGGVVFANAAWRDSFATSGQIPTLQKLVSSFQPSPYEYIDMVNFGWRSGESPYLNVPENPINNWTNDEAKSLYLKMLLNAADSLKPAYFFVGNEISFYWQQDSTDYLNWVNFYHQAYDSIKIHSPESKVGTVFNFEHLAGVGILTGFNSPYWSAFDVLDTSKFDILGLTVYPFFSYKTANEIPQDYLSPLFERLGGKPVVLTETGWPADSFIGSWISSPQQQVGYVHKLFEIIDEGNVEVVNWLFLNYLVDRTDNTDFNIFRSVALRDSLGYNRPALPIFLSYCGISAVSEDVYPTKKSYFLSQNYPNPFNPKTTIDFQLPKQSYVEISILNSLGQLIRTAKSKNYSAGTHSIEWNGRDDFGNDLGSGIYFYNLKADNFSETRKMLLIR
jgi:hypothetical protein